MLISTILYGSIFGIAKDPLKSVDSIMFASIVYIISGIALFPAVSSLKLPSKKEIPWITLITILGSTIAPFLLFYGLSQTEASDAAILVNGEIIFSIILAWVFFGDRPNNLLKIISIIIVVSGLILATTDLKSGNLFQYKVGNIMILGSMMAWAMDNNISRRFLKHTDYNPSQLALLKSLFGGIILLIISFLTGTTSINIPLVLWPQVVVMSVFGFGYALLFFLKGLKIIGTLKTMIIFSLTPIFGILVSTLTTGNFISPLQIFAVTVIIFGIVIFTRS